MLGRFQLSRIRKQIAQHLVVPAIRIVVVIQEVLLARANGVFISDEQLERAMRKMRGPVKLRVPCRRPMVYIDNRCRRPACSRNVRGGLRWHVLRVDRSFQSTTLESSRGSKTNHSATDHRRRAGSPGFGNQIRSEPRRAPRERHPGPAVTVVVNKQLVAECFSSNDETRRTKRAKADNGSNNSFRSDVDRRKVTDSFPGQCGRIDYIGFDAPSASRVKRDSAGEQADRSKRFSAIESPSVHQISVFGRVRDNSCMKV